MPDSLPGNSYGRKSTVFSASWSAIQLAFLSRSSVGTLPNSEAVTERLGVDKGYSDFAEPILAENGRSLLKPLKYP